MKTDNLVKSLQKLGIKSAAYKRPPVNRDVFAISIQPKGHEGLVTINQGLADIEIFGDKRRRQAAITVKEKGRKVTRPVKYDFPIGEERPDDAKVKDMLIRRFPVGMPGNAHWTYKDTKLAAVQPVKGALSVVGRPYWRVTAIVTARVLTRTVNHFLIGMDEKHYFISPLPKAAKSVDGAHRILRPPGLSKHAVRQGEWFFDPVGAQTERLLNGIVYRDAQRVHEVELKNSTHVAKSAVTIKNRLFARGYIVDSRSGHHDALFLKTWHGVVRNKEIAIKAGADARRRSFD